MKLDECPFKEDQDSISVLSGSVGHTWKLPWQGRDEGLVQGCTAMGQAARGLPARGLPILPMAVIFGGGLGLFLPHLAVARTQEQAFLLKCSSEHLPSSSSIGPELLSE